ncbi:nuclear transport factor 2 family protein [Kribbella sp. CA-247076]|uniref:nuclear transport factor 2 family protein n=1 Tax=Kribbella sp. CA-247076 TaxID=3239941 RepID=UPI003D928976
MSGSNPAVLQRLLTAVNAHDLDALVGCFAGDYRNETPAHPQRGFRGQDQVRRNWTQIFAGVPDISARVTRSSADGDALWTEWEMSGPRADEGGFLMRGVVIFGVTGDLITSARFYLEPVDEDSGGVDDAVRRVAGDASGAGGRGTS